MACADDVSKSRLQNFFFYEFWGRFGCTFPPAMLENSWLMLLVVHYYPVSSYRAFGKFREHSGG